jgi:hypothetical protein
MQLARLTAAAVTLATSTTAAADGWTVSVTPYLWATDTVVDLSIADRDLVDATIPFEDLLDNLEAVTQIRMEAIYGAHGLSLDLFNVELADNNSRMTLPEPLAGEMVLDSQVGMTILDLVGTYDPAGDGLGASLRYGTRILDLRDEVHLEFTPSAGETSIASHRSDDRYVDALIGLRYVGQLAGNWRYEMVVDVSTGGTELTWSVAPAIEYRFGSTEQLTFTAGYRHMVVDFDTPDPVDLNLTLTGPLLGLRISF